MQAGSLLQDLVDAHVFEDAQDIIHSLQRHNCGPALAWCAANKPRLKKAKSKLEFKLRVQVSCSGAADWSG